jgi:hypothetical protein
MGGVGSSSSRETLIDKPLAAAGAMMAEPVARAVLIAMKIATPMIQAFLLMGIYFMMAGVLVLSSYNLKVVMIGAIAIFSVKFWTVLWAIAGWVDENLITAMFPERRALLESFLLSSAEWIASAGAAIGGMSGGGLGAMDHVTKRVILDLVMASMYVALPVLWTAMVGWAGYEVLSISRVGSTMGASTQKAGGAAAQTGVNVATRSIRPGK